MVLLAALAIVAASGLQKKTLAKGDCSVKAENGDSVKARVINLMFICHIFVFTTQLLGYSLASV